MDAEKNIIIKSPLTLGYYKGNIVAVYHYNHKTLRYNLFKVEEKYFLPKMKALKVAPDKYDAAYEVNRMVVLANRVNTAIIELSKTKTKDKTITKKEIDEWLKKSDEEKAEIQEPQHPRVPFIEEYTQWIQEYKRKKRQEDVLKGIVRNGTHPSVKDFISTLNLLKDFQYDKYNDKPFYFDDINDGFFEELIMYAFASRGDDGDEEDDANEGEPHKYLTKGNLANKTLNKRLDCMFQFMREHYHTLPEGVVRKPRLLTVDKKIIRLDREELRQLEELEIIDTDNTHYGFYRDCFLFLCYTGLRFGDFYKLNRTYYHEEDNLIVLSTEKTRKRCEIFLFDKAKEIGEKYNYDFKPISNQTLNRGIKEMLKAYDLFPDEITIEYMSYGRRTITKKKRELITCHTGRRTYISIMLENGMDVYDLISTTGHTNIQILKHYIDLFGKKRIEKFKNINELLK